MTTDIALVGILVALCILYAVWRDTDALLTLLLALPTAAFIYTIFPYHELLLGLAPGVPEYVLLLSLFVGFLLMVLWVFVRTFGSAHGGEGAMHIMSVSLILVLLLVTLSYHLTPAIDIYTFSASFDAFFEPEASLFWILITILVMILFV